MSEQPDTSPGTETATGHQIRADRPCARCGFNLFGQTVFREPRYGLIAARCPECGQLAALQEYPSLGRWAGRWAALLSAAWVLVIVGVLCIQFGINFGIMMSTTEMNNDWRAQCIAEAYQQDSEAGRAAKAAAQTNYGPWTSIESEWWIANKERIIAESGGRLAMINWWTALLNLPLMIAGLVFGIFWANALLGARRYQAAMLGVLPICVAASLMIPTAFALLGNRSGYLTALNAYASISLPLMLPAFLLVAAGSCLVGVLVGRKAARCLVRITLPPRMRASLGVLWTRDGLPLPGAGGGTRGGPGGGSGSGDRAS